MKIFDTMHVELIFHLKNRGFFREIDLTQLNDALEQNNF